jgi:hypothetical protein
MGTPIDTIGRLASLLVGLSVATAAVASWRVPGGTGLLGADVRLLASPIGELEVDPTGPVLSATNLHPGSAPVHGEVAVRNQTGSTLSVRIRALPSLPDLDALLMVRVDVGEDALFDGPLSQLRSGSDRSFLLASGERRVLQAKILIPPTVAGGYEGRVADVGLEMKVAVVRP